VVAPLLSRRGDAHGDVVEMLDTEPGLFPASVTERCGGH